MKTKNSMISNLLSLIAFLAWCADAAVLPEPTQIIRSQVMTYSYGGFGQLKTVQETTNRILSPSEKARLPRMVDFDSDMLKSEPDPFSIPDIESYSLDEKSQPNYINQQDPKVQEVDVVGWFE